LNDVATSKGVTVQKVTSRDGTPIAVDRVGQGPPIVLVVGAFNDHATGAPLAEVLKSRFTVYNYDRRGRGDSGDATPYAVEREIEDLDAVITEAGGSAFVFGYSSGGVLALEGAAGGLPITRVAVYDVPLKAGGPLWSIDHAAELARLVDAGRRGDAVEYFQAKVVGIPEDVVAQLRHAPFRPALEAMARTLVYEATIAGDGSLPIDLIGSITVPTLAIAGAASVPFMRETADAIARAVANGRSMALEGQTHDLDASVLGPILVGFFQ
jgi:pimeloyl-ACP methyl ester carboxylesterase